MDLLVNDLSLHGQFPDLSSFTVAIQRIMQIRQITRRFGCALHCSRNILSAQVTANKAIQQAVQALSRNERNALMQWLTQHGPFWDEPRNHGPDDWIECMGRIVTDTAVGEAAWCCLNGIERGLVSFNPSDWMFSPVPAAWVTETTGRKPVDVVNHWEPSAIEVFLQNVSAPPTSWEELEALAVARFTGLTFAVDAFAPLNGYPFSSSATQRLIFLLDTLHRFKACFDVNGQRTLDGHEIYRNFFTGKKGEGGHGALFSDSSDYEKGGFKKEMTFKHPLAVGETLFCPWHGKVQTPQLRIHFSWPVTADSPLFVVYVGPKLTKR